MCIGLPPGVCCEVPPDPEFDELYPKKHVQFHGLGPFDIAAAFSAEPPHTGCTGRALASSSSGEGEFWEHQIAEGDNRNITGASYVRLPAREPTEVEKAWLEGEGGLAFFTEDSQWISRRINGGAALAMAARFGLGTAGGGLSGLPRIKRLGKRVVDIGRMNMGRVLSKRGVSSRNKGLMIFEGPKERAWAATIEVDGVQYTAKTPQSQVYVSADGRVLDYTKPAS
ncbi:MAG: hypothetical protein Q9216_004509 [Gyalolechia sp. 2 TL-2023]